MRWSLVVAGEAGLVLFLLVWGNTFIESTAFHRVQVGILAILGGLGWLVILQRPGRLPTLLIVAPFPLLASLVITATMSSHPDLSWYAVWQCAAFIGIAWLLTVQATIPAGRRNMVAAMGIVLVLVLGAYLLQAVTAWIEWVRLGFPVTSVLLRPLGSGGLVALPTWLADVVVVAGPLVVIALWTRGARVAAASLVAVAGLALVLSGTRSVLLLVAVAAAVVVMLSNRHRAGRRTGALVAAATVVVLVVGFATFFSGRSFDEGRGSAFTSAIVRFGESPLVGSGPGTYGVERLRDPIESMDLLVFPDAHNVILTSASDSGIVGLVGLALMLLLYGTAIFRLWRGSPERRATIAAAMFAIALLGGHALVDVTFALVGVLILLLMNVAHATAPDPIGSDPARPRSRPVGAIVALGLLVFAWTFGQVITTERAVDQASTAGRLVADRPGEAAAAALQARTTAPGLAGAWWVQMVAADAAGDGAGAVAAARRLIDLEGFAQEWVALGILADRAGDAPAARAAFDHVSGVLPLDPMVELNAAIFDDATGATAKARAAAMRLLAVQPDIEPALKAQPAMAALVAGVRPDAVAARMVAKDIDGALIIALSGEDRALANGIVDQVAKDDPAEAAGWRQLVQAWFGDAAARTAYDAATTAAPTYGNLTWSWRLAAHGCDSVAATRWERALQILARFEPAAPVTVGVAPGFHVQSLPARYPSWIWRTTIPEHPAVNGIWSIGLGRPACGS